MTRGWTNTTLMKHEEKNFGDHLKILSEDEESIEIACSEEFTITLDSNPTTGYVWKAEFDGNYIELLGKTFEQRSSGIGSGGKENFQFKGVKDGETSIKMICKRTWEDEPIKTKSFLVSIK
ncbi:MAG: protease inhibitor I42 family protein [Thermoplasmata archaeon]|nr:MAG: protease inhibitor I42 family protein [Thermoplasmata archaeon]